jgi:hypothetical protein
MKWLSPCTRIPTIVRSSLEAQAGNRMTDREMIQHLSPLALNIDIAVHLLIIERAEKRSPRCFTQRSIEEAAKAAGIGANKALEPRLWRGC